MMDLGENNYNTYKVEQGSKIDARNIDVAQYFMTLTSEAAAVGILSESELADMQTQISDILADIIWQYNAGKSTSVTTEIASDLIESIVFALDFFCIFTVKSTNSTFGNDRCVELLKPKGGVKNCYAKGIEYIAQAANHSANLYNKLASNKLNIRIAPYNSTINKSLALFFKKYDVRFFPHKTVVSTPFDYSLALSSELNKYKGILYVSEYLRYLSLENEFCALFGAENVQRLMERYASGHGFLVSDLMENVFEKVFANILFSMLADSNSVSLSIKREQYNQIAAHFYDNEGIDGLLCEYTQKLIINFGIQNLELQKYLLRYQKIFAERVSAVAARNYLHNLIIYDDVIRDDYA